MTKAELVKLLEQFEDNQHISILAEQADGTRHQLGLQRVEAYCSWNDPPDDQSKWIIGLHVHIHNSDVTKMAPRTFMRT